VKILDQMKKNKKSTLSREAITECVS
jgi:hypothetical protein